MTEPTSATMSPGEMKLANILLEWSRGTLLGFTDGSRLVELVWPLAVAEGCRLAAEAIRVLDPVEAALAGQDAWEIAASVAEEAAPND